MIEGEKNQGSFSKASGSFFDPLDNKQVPAEEGSEGSATNQDLCIVCQNQKLQQFHNVVEEMANVLADNLEKLNASYKNALQIIESAPKQKNEKLDPNKKQLKEKATEMKNIHETKLKALIEENESNKSELDDIIQNTKQAQQRLWTMRSDIARIKESLEENYEFLISDEIVRIIPAESQQGKLTVTPERLKRKRDRHGTILENLEEDKKTLFKCAKTENTIQE